MCHHGLFGPKPQEKGDRLGYLPLFLTDGANPTEECNMRKTCCESGIRRTKYNLDLSVLIPNRKQLSASLTSLSERFPSTVTNSQEACQLKFILSLSRHWPSLASVASGKILLCPPSFDGSSVGRLLSGPPQSLSSPLHPLLSTIRTPFIGFRTHLKVQGDLISGSFT